MKKSTKSSKPATPQVKSASKPVASKPAKPTKAPTKSPSASKAAKPAKAPKVAKSAAATPVAAPKPLPSTPIPSVTTVTARIDIGFGNTLFLRGEGPGLSWNQGVALDCVDDDKWTITLPGANRPVIFKFLVNDLTWSAGSDYVIEPGATVVLTPTF